MQNKCQRLRLQAHIKKVFWLILLHDCACLRKLIGILDCTRAHSTFGEQAKTRWEWWQPLTDFQLVSTWIASKEMPLAHSLCPHTFTIYFSTIDVCIFFARLVSITLTLDSILQPQVQWVGWKQRRQASLACRRETLLVYGSIRKFN